MDTRKSGDNRRTMRIDDPVWDALGELAYRRGRGVSISDVLRQAAERELRDAGLWPPPGHAEPALDPAAYTEGGRTPVQAQKRSRR